MHTLAHVCVTLHTFASSCERMRNSGVEEAFRLRGAVRLVETSSPSEVPGATIARSLLSDAVGQSQAVMVVMLDPVLGTGSVESA